MKLHDITNYLESGEEFSYEIGDSKMCEYSHTHTLIHIYNTIT